MDKKDKNVELMDELMGTVVQTKVWIKEQQENPEILAADKQLEEALGAIKGIVPNNVIVQITDAAWGYASAFENAAILYGLRVADAIHDIAARPSDLSQYILDRVAKRQAEAQEEVAV